MTSIPVTCFTPRLVPISRTAMNAGSKDLQSIRKTMDRFVGALPIPADSSIEDLECNGVPAAWITAPLYADLSGLPLLLIRVSTSEVLLDQGPEVARRAQAARCKVTLQP